MILSLSGTHCTGKSTLIEALKKMPEFKNFTFVKSTGKGFSDFGIKINEGGDFLSQLYLLCRDIQQIIEIQNEKHVICDRCYMDTFFYSTYLHEKGLIEDSQIQILYDMVREIEDIGFGVDKIGLLKPTFQLQNENERSMSTTFQKRMQDIFHEFYLENTDCVEYLPNNFEDRIEFVKKYFKL